MTVIGGEVKKVRKGNVGLAFKELKWIFKPGPEYYLNSISWPFYYTFISTPPKK